MTNITRIIEKRDADFNSIKESILISIIGKVNINHPDVLMIKQEEKESIGIDQVKSLKSWVYTKPYDSEKKVVVIENADLLTTEAQNSILKITEEPPEFTYIYLLVENVRNILPTIISRSEVISDANQSTNDEEIEFLSLTIIEKFKFIDTLSKENKKTIKIFIDKLINHYRKQNDFQINEKLLFYKSTLDVNVNKKLILDNIAILTSKS